MDKKDTRIVFMGTPEISADTLRALISAGYNIVGVIAQPDREVGRKHILTSVPTKVVANEFNIPVYQPEKIRKDYEFLEEINPDLIITLAYGQIVPQGVLDIPKLGCINLHGSLLPKYRGAAPMQYALMNNEKETGFSLMEMTKDMDAGKVFAIKKVSIDENDNFSSLLCKMSECAKELILETLDQYIAGELIGVPQDESLVTFCPTIKPEEERISLDKSIEEIFGQIRALSEVPGAYLFINEEKVKIFEAKIVSKNTSKSLNTIIKADKTGLDIQLKDGVLSIIRLQKVGKNKMSYRDYINGNHNLLGLKIS